MSDGTAPDSSLTRRGRPCEIERGEPLGGAPWLRNEVRRAATCWLGFGPWGTRELGSTARGTCRESQHETRTSSKRLADRDERVGMGRKPDATRPGGRALDLATMPDAMRVADPTKSFGMDDEQSARESRTGETLNKKRCARGPSSLRSKGLTKWSSAASVASPLQRRVRRSYRLKTKWARRFCARASSLWPGENGRSLP